ncbi:MAG: alpha/beta fold hydrolase [Maricaulaceae bacterium]
MKTNWLLLVVGWALVLGGGYLAHAIQTSGGVTIEDVRFPLDEGRELSGLLYTPANATAETPAPGILAVHGYINSRETQSGFAIEFARRGYVVLAMDQVGHGFSDGVAIEPGAGFGGPAGLAYLRSLPQVDTDRIGLEGHSMGGWTVLAAASSDPDGYRSLVLAGSSVGAPFAAPGTTEFPRNTAVIFSEYDEFAPLMWGVTEAADVENSDKLKALFGTDAPVVEGEVYGSIDEGTGRRLTTPLTTHPGDHLSTEAIGDAVAWMNMTLRDGDVAATAADDQIWYWKEIGTLIALLGGVLVVLGTFDLLIALPWFSSVALPGDGAQARASLIWWISLAVAATIPAATYFPLVAWGARFTGLELFPQNITNQILTWALGNGLIAIIFAAIAFRRGNEGGLLKKLVAAVLSVGMLYLAVIVLDVAFKADMRFWVVALKPLGPNHLAAFLAYLVPFTAFFYISQRALHATLSLIGAGGLAQYATGFVATAGGFLVMVAGIYIWLFATGAVPSFADALFSIVAMQFVAVLAIVGLIAVFTWRRTNGPLSGALICGLFVTWYIVAGQATHV